MHVIVKEPLPGVRAQLEMAPEHRVAGLKKSEIPKNAVDSAVLVMLTPVNAGESPKELLDWKVLLIRRNCYPGVHSGQIAFPGGKREKGDNGFWDTACREAREEVGVARRDLEKIGPLSSIYIPPSNFAIHPFVAVHKADESFRADPREVVEYKNIPVKVFNPAKSVVLDFENRDGTKQAAPAWLYQDFTVWGATAMILSELYHLIAEQALIRT